MTVVQATPKLHEIILYIHKAIITIIIQVFPIFLYKKYFKNCYAFGGYFLYF